MKTNNFIRFLKYQLFLVLVVSLVFILSCAGYTQQEVKTIRYTQQVPTDIDPAVGKSYSDAIVLCNLYDTLVFPNPDGSVDPWLAKDWEISEDGLTYTFELVPGIKFHNGDELTADDVVFSMERLATIGEGFGYLFETSVEGGKVLEKYKFQFKLKQPFGPFLGSLVRLYILNKDQVMENIQKEGSYGEFGDYAKSWLAFHDAGSGPYKIKDKIPGEHILMEKFDDFWAGWENKDAPQYVKQIATTEPVTVRALMSRGQLELTDNWQSRENIVAMEKLSNTELSTFFEGSLMNIMLHTKKPPTDDIHFRKALAYCIDYQQIIDKIFPGSRLTGPVAPSTPGYNPDLVGIYKLDLEKAQEEIKKSPYYGKLDQYPIEIHWPSSSADREQICLMIQSNAAKIGIKVEIIKTPWISMINNMTKMESSPHASVVTVSPHYAEAGSVLQARYHSSSCGTWEEGEWLQDPEIDAMIEDALSTIDQKERFQKYYLIQEKIVEICPTLWLLEGAIRQIYRVDYVVYPAAEATKKGEACNPVKGYNQYYRDFKVTPEKAQLPYTPFKP